MENKNLMRCPECGCWLSPLGFFNGMIKGRKCPMPKCRHVFRASEEMFNGAMAILNECINRSAEDNPLWDNWEQKVMAKERDICLYTEIGLAYAKFMYLNMWAKSLGDQAVDKKGIKNIFDFGRKLTTDRRKAWMILARDLHRQEHDGCMWQKWIN